LPTSRGVGPDLSRVFVRIEKQVARPARLLALAELILLWNCRSQCWLMEAVVGTAADPLRTHRGRNRIGRVPPTTGVLAAGADEVSAAVAALAKRSPSREVQMALGVRRR
jgi:hypothetical protein